jgi:glycosidase
MLATFLFTLQGTPFVFQGQEIGMTNADWEREEIRDVESANYVDHSLDDWAHEYADVRAAVEARSRDNARTPMQWSDEENAGFSQGEPWIKVNERYDEINVEAARDDPESIWHYYRDLIDLREERDIFVYGDYELLLADHGEVFAYRRTLGDEELLVVCNFFDDEPELDLSAEADGRDVEYLVGNYETDDATDLSEPIRLRPYETRVYDLS